MTATGRQLLRDEIEQLWTIDRKEVIDAVYHLENGALVLTPEHHDVSGWPAGEAEKYTPILRDCFDRGGWFYGEFDRAKVVGVVVLDSKRIGKRKDQLQLQFLHVSRAYRNRGMGAKLFRLAMETARQRGAMQLYISATPSENTVNFYMRLGCKLTAEPDPELVEREPDDIHLECDV